MSQTANIVAVARRELAIRIRTRSFLLGTLLLVLGVVLIALLPTVIGKIDAVDATKVTVVAADEGLAQRSSATISTLLNASSGAGQQATSASAGQPDFVVSIAKDLAAAREAVTRGEASGVLGIERGADGALAFTYYSNDPASGRTASLLQQAANAIAVADRLDRMSISAAQQATLFAPATFAVAWPDPARTEPIKGAAAAVGQDMLAFGMTILIFMIILMYGNWIAMSVVEEKSSRVMEVVLNAATPFQLLAGKVLGVGLVAFIQYAAVVVFGAAALLAQPAIQSAVLGVPTSATVVPQGLTPGLLLLFGLYGILGFLLYASLYAAAGSLVSRMEDVSAAVMPMTLISTGGYMVGVYASMGLLDPHAGWITGLTLVPFLSPFMMLGRVSAGAATPWELVVSLVLLGAMIVVAIWVAARIYAVGVLLYGQRPGARAVWRLLREGM